MLRHIKSSTAFYDALRNKTSQWLGLPEQKFLRVWENVDFRFDQEWLGRTSSFNVDTWLIQCLEATNPELKRRRKDVERLFFEVRGEGDFGPHLVGRVIPWVSAEGGKAKIVEVWLTERLGMGYRMRDSAGHCFQTEKFD